MSSVSKRQSFVVAECPGFRSLDATPDSCTACLNHRTDCKSTTAKRCGGFSSTKEDSNKCKNCWSTGMACPALPSGRILGCGAFHSVLAEPNKCINCGLRSEKCSSPKGTTDYIKGCGQFRVNGDDLTHCMNCRQVWTKCLGNNGGVYPWDDPLTATPDMPRMKPENARRLQKIYAILDDEGNMCDGSVPSAKVIDILRIFGANPAREDEQKALRSLDVDSDGNVSFREMCSYFAKEGAVIAVSSDEQKRIHLLDLMKSFDTNNDGRFSKKEMKKILTSMGQPLTNDEYTACFKGLDMNQDGYLSFDELLPALEA